MSDEKLLQRIEALESQFSQLGMVNVGDYGNDQEYPYFAAIRINPALLKQVQFDQSVLTNALQLMAQAKLNQDPKQADVLMRLTDDIIDDWCGTKVPGKFPPRPHWSDIIKELGRLTETLNERSILREAAFDLSRRVLDRAYSLNKAGNRQQMTSV